MILDCVLTAVNENELYLDFVPIFIKTWTKLYPNVDVKIILIAKKIPECLLYYKSNIILFEPIENVLTSFTSQFIRLLYPCILNYENGVMITDIDILPMNRTYYTENIKSYDNNKFIYYRGNICFEDKQIAMCYNIATPKIWKNIFEITSLEDIRSKINHIYHNNIIKEGHGNIGWYIDQLILYDRVINWNKQTNNFVCLNENKTRFKRLDKNRFNINDLSIRNENKNRFKRLDKNRFNINELSIRNNITSGNYTDYHCYRPMSKYSQINYIIYDLL